VSTALSIRNLEVSYGQTQVLFGVDLDVNEGEMLALLGVNGAGKSTLLKAICGLLAPTTGSIKLSGEEIAGMRAEKIAPKKISMVPGGRGVFPTLTVSENLRIAGWMSRKDRKQFSSARDYVLDLFPVLRGRSDQMAGNLSGGEQQMLTLAQSFITRPEVLVIDELSLGLAPIIVGGLMSVVRSANQLGTTVILVEQSLNLALELCERAVFMEKGQVKFDGRSYDLAARPDLLRSVFLEGAMPGQQSSSHAERIPSITNSLVLGLPELPNLPDNLEDFSASNDAPQMEDPSPSPPSRPWRPGDPVKVRPLALEALNIGVSFGGILALDNVTLRLHQGEIIAVIGSNGAGKTTLFDVISGFVRPDTGRVLLAGRNVTNWSPSRRSRAGLGRSFQDALLFSSLTVRETIAVSLDRHAYVRDPISLALGFPAARDSEEDILLRSDELIRDTGLSDFSNSFLSELSTGTRRMVDLACSLAHDPEVLMLDEPAAGIAQKETEALGPLILRIRDQIGASILIVEHDMPLIRAIADSVLVLEAGAPIAFGTPADVLSDSRVVASYLGSESAAIERSGSGQ